MFKGKLSDVLKTRKQRWTADINLLMRGLYTTNGVFSADVTALSGGAEHSQYEFLQKKPMQIGEI